MNICSWWIPSDETNETFPLSAHRSLLAPARARLCVSNSSLLSTLPFSLPSPNLLFSCFLSHGCQEFPTPFDTQIADMGPCPTVRSSDIKPSTMSSAKTRERLIIDDQLNAIIKVKRIEFVMRYNKQINLL